MMPLRLRLVTGVVLAVWCVMGCALALGQMPEPRTTATAREPKVYSLWLNGGRHPAQPMGLSASRIEQGWPREVAGHIRAEREFRPDGVIVHLPWGTMDVHQMEFDARQVAREVPQLFRVTDEAALVAAMLMHWELVGAEQWYYLGSPEHSATLTRLWDTRNIGGWRARVRASIAPLTTLRDEGVPVGIMIDMAGHRPEGSQSHALAAYLLDLGFRVGVEPRLKEVAGWANRGDIPVISQAAYWARSDPEIYADARALGALGAGAHRGEIILIVTGADAEERAKRARETVRAGHSVALGVWPGSLPEGTTSGKLRR